MAALLLVLVSAVLYALRLYAAYHVGFGDSEALYASYALHPQPAYLDHPGLIALVDRALGGGGAPTPLAAHLATAVLATLVPWAGVLTTRAAGASWRGAFGAGLVYALVPEMAVGLFGLTPDLPLAFLWLGTLALAALGLRAAPGSARAAICLLGAGLLAGVATATKVSGATLVLALAVTYATRPARRFARGGWPWAGLVAGAIVVAPVVLFEARSGWPMLRHRLVETQQGAGPSLRNLGAFIVGQLTYLSPVIAVAAGIVAVDLWRSRRAAATASRSAPFADAAVTQLLFWATFVPMAVLVPLSLWSRVAEPHWVAPALMALPIHWSRQAGGSPSPHPHERGELRSPPAPPLVARPLRIWALATAGAMVAAVYAWVLVPSLARLVPASYDPRYDLANELVGWPQAIQAVHQTVLEETQPGTEPGDVVVVAPHWVICAQLHAALRETWPAKDDGTPAVPIVCQTPIPDDFDRWWPRAAAQRADTVIFVTDNRFEVDPAPLFPGFTPIRARTVTIPRGGKLARVFHIVVLSKRGAG